MRRIVTLAALSMAVATVNAQVLYDNGGIVNSPGGGFGGADLSRDIPGGPIGFSIYRAGAGPNFRLADDFTVSGAGWNVTGISAFAYSTSTGYANPPVSPFTAVSINIYSGIPGAGGTIVASSTTMGENVWTGAYRVSNTAAATDRSRPVFRVQATFAGVTLGPGTYWADMQMVSFTNPTGGTTAFCPEVMLPGLPPAAATGNGRQMTTATGTWVALTGGTVSQTMAIPFLVHGTVVPEPATMAVLGMGALALLRRRRK